MFPSSGLPVPDQSGSLDLCYRSVLQAEESPSSLLSFSVLASGASYFACAEPPYVVTAEHTLSVSQDIFQF